MLSTLTEIAAERRQQAAWTNTHSLLADVCDYLQAIWRQGVKDPPPFKPYPRPGDKADSKPKTVRSRDLAKRLAKSKKRK